MKPFARGPAPAPLDESPGSVKSRQEWYANLRDPDGEIRPRWNSRSGGIATVRVALAAMSGEECAWCGDRILASRTLHVDHYLPKEDFPRLAYCWVNLLPSCGPCNLHRKGRYRPPAVEPDTLVDRALDVTAPARHHDHAHLLDTVAERLVDPSAENPVDHLTFAPESHGYRPSTRAGEVTVARFFDEKSDANRWRELSRIVEWFVDASTTTQDLDDALARYIAAHGRSFYVRAYADHFLALPRKESRL